MHVYRYSSEIVISPSHAVCEKEVVQANNTNFFFQHFLKASCSYEIMVRKYMM